MHTLSQELKNYMPTNSKIIVEVREFSSSHTIWQGRVGPTPVLHYWIIFLHNKYINDYVTAEYDAFSG